MFRTYLRPVVTGVVAMFLLAGTGFADTYRIDPAHSSVEFSIRHIFSQVKGQFGDFSGEIVYDPKHEENSSVTAIIKVASIDTDNERRDNHLRTPDFFDAARYTEMQFQSVKVSREGDRLMVEGDLSMHGVTKRIVLPVDILGVGIHPMTKAPVAGFAAVLTIQRSDFGVNSWTDAAGILGDDVKITLNLEANGTTKAVSGNPCNPCNPCNACNPCNPGGS